jgi:TatD DNase family protein
MLYDVHFHPTDEPLSLDVEGVMRRARDAGVSGGLATGYDPASCQAVLRLAETVPGLSAAVGFHPWFVRDDLDVALLRPWLAHPRVVALGEIGLDGKVEVDFDLQRRFFLRQLELARELGLPVVVHSRHAFEQTLSAVRQVPGVRGILHSFGGAPEVAAGFLDLGWYFSLSGSVTRVNARRVHRLARFLPEDRLLFETDAPAIGLEGIPPEQVEPACVRKVLQAVAALRAVPPAVLEARAERNLETLFGCPL